MVMGVWVVGGGGLFFCIDENYLFFCIVFFFVFLFCISFQSLGRWVAGSLGRWVAGSLGRLV